MGTRRAYTAPAHASFGQDRKWVRWNKAMRDTFLDHLAATCNVRESAAVIGVIPGSVYALRRREPQFAAQWDEALALGYQMLETLLVGHLIAGGKGRNDTLKGGVDTVLGPLDVEAVTRLLGMHRNASGKPRVGGLPRQYAKPDETDKVLLHKLRQIEARRAATEAER